MAEWGDPVDATIGVRASIEEMPDEFMEAWLGSQDHKKQVEYYEAQSEEEQGIIDAKFDAAFGGLGDNWRDPDCAQGELDSCESPQKKLIAEVIYVLMQKAHPSSNLLKYTIKKAK